jgi:hypothetical protein
MDPNATLRLIADTVFDSGDECINACRDLSVWLRNGGFQPDWDACPAGLRRFKKYDPHYFALIVKNK